MGLLNQNKSVRNYGIDLLRILAMFMIVMLHTLKHGGILDGASILSGKWMIVWLLESLAISSVNCYALISGYVGWQVSVNVYRILKLWVQVLFYSIVITVIFYCLRPDFVGLKDWVRTFFPVLHGQYWYVSSYFGVLLLAPFLNYFVRQIEFRTFLSFLLVILIGFVLPKWLYADPFKLNDGYSTLWLAILYVVGGCLSKFQVYSRVSKRFCLLAFFTATTVTLGGGNVSSICVDENFRTG